MKTNKSRDIKIYTERDSFINDLYEEFYINSYNDDVPEALNRIAPHRHTYHEIIWVQSGTGTHTIDFCDYTFAGPCLFLLHPQNIHTIKKDGPSKGGVIKFTPAIFPGNEAGSDYILQCGVFDDIDVLPVIPLTTEQSDEIGKIFTALYQEYHHFSALTPQILSSYLNIFLLKVYGIKKINVCSDPLQSPEIVRFRTFQHLLEQNFKQHHAPSFYAEQLKITGKTLGNTIRHVSGRSPSALIKQRILLEAKRMLYQNNRSVKEIAYDLGFVDSSYFIRFFKLNAKTSPLFYKNKKL